MGSLNIEKINEKFEDLLSVISELVNRIFMLNEVAATERLRAVAFMLAHVKTQINAVEEMPGLTDEERVAKIEFLSTIFNWLLGQLFGELTVLSLFDLDRDVEEIKEDILDLCRIIDEEGNDESKRESLNNLVEEMQRMATRRMSELLESSSCDYIG